MSILGPCDSFVFPLLYCSFQGCRRSSRRGGQVWQKDCAFSQKYTHFILYRQADKVCVNPNSIQELFAVSCA